MRLTKSNIIILTFLLICLISGLYSIYLANELSDDILQAAVIRKEIVQISQENALLRAEIIENSSYRVISEKAAEFGFGKPTEYIDIRR